jgi:HPr kinase/phosphorylase
VTTPSPSVHASAALVGTRAVLVRGPAGAGKSRLVLSLIEAAETGRLPFARLVADDRVHLDAHHGRLLARAPDTLAGLIEIRGVGIRRLPYEPVAAVGWVVDLASPDAERLPEPSQGRTTIAGIALPRLAVAPGEDAFVPLLTLLASAPGLS